VQEATNRDGTPEDIALSAFIDRCALYFEGEGRIIDQAFQPRIVEGMVRCYMSGGTLIGFCRQYPQGYRQGATPENTFGLPSEKEMLPVDAAAFRGLRIRLEGEWVNAMCRSVGLDETALPALWDADFMFGPKDSTGEDRFILCEINASCVSPFPKEAPTKIAEYVLERVQRPALGP
jgi:hypothetical protein